MKATEVTAGLAESNGSLQPGLWRDSLHVTCGLTACTLGSARGPTLGNEYGEKLYLYFFTLLLCQTAMRSIRIGLYSLQSTTSLQFCVNSVGCQYRDEWSSRLHVWHTIRLRQQHRRTSLPTFNSSLSTVVVITAHLPTEHSLFHAHVPLSATEVLLSQDRVCGTVYRLL